MPRQKSKESKNTAKHRIHKLCKTVDMKIYKSNRLNRTKKCPSGNLLMKKGMIQSALAAGFGPDEIYIMLRNDGLTITPNSVRDYCVAISSLGQA